MIGERLSASRLRIEMNKRIKFKGPFANLLLILASLIISVVLIEVFFRIFLPQDLIIPMPAQEDEELIYRMSPNTKSYIKGTSVRWYHLETNSLGFRDSEYNFTKSKGTFRVLLLGDSMSMGEGVELQETFIKQFESIIVKKCPNEKIETINAAIRGYGTDQALILYQRIGIKFDPDLVILGFFEGNDFKDNRLGGLFKLDGEEIIQTIPSEEKSPKYLYYSKQIKIQNFPGYRFFVGHSHFVNFLRKRIARLLSSRIVTDSEETEKVVVSPEDWKLTTKIIERWKSYCRDNGSVPLILFLPTVENLVAISEGNLDNSRRMDLKMKEFALDNQILWINAVEAMVYESNPASFYLKDGHLNPRGHRKLAQKVAQFFIDRNIVCKKNRKNTF